MRTVAACLKDRGRPGASPPTLLDIGCVGGLAFDELSQFGEVYGIEPDPHLVDSCPKWRNRVTLAMFDRQYQPDQKFDLITMLDVLEHIEDDGDALAHVHELLNPGGYLILTVPALQSLWSVHDEVNLHYRRYRAQPLGALLAERGFSTEQLRYFFTWPLGLMYLRRWMLGTRRREGHDYAVRVPPAPVNRLFYGLSSGEQVLMRSGIPLPVGSSLLAVARRPL
jgi:SAM-dependent methyltransferase